MKVHELFTMLKDVDPEQQVFIASDEEWNSIKNLYQVDEVAVEEQDEYYRVEPIAEEDLSGYLPEEYERVLVLW